MARAASAADLLVERERERLERMSLDDRVQEALTLGAQAVDLLVECSGVDPREARRVLARERHRGRRPSVAALVE
jgi:endonuclease V-like protein UPF0215 family